MYLILFHFLALNLLKVFFFFGIFMEFVSNNLLFVVVGVVCVCVF